MSLEEAILRKIRRGESFCSYQFKAARASNGSIVLKADVRRKNDTKHTESSEVSSQDTVKLSKIQIENSEKPMKKSILQTDLYPKQFNLQPRTLTSNKNKSNVSSQKSNKIEEYLSDYFALKQNSVAKSNQFENTPKNICNFKLENSKFKLDRPYSALHKFDYKKFRQIQPKIGFNPISFPQFFYDFCVGDNHIEQPFIDFTMVNLSNYQYVMGAINENLFHDIPMKQYQKKLNNFSTDPKTNVFYTALRKKKLQNQQLPYTQGYFWISQPIKHNERIQVLKEIKKFIQNYLTLCLKMHPKLKDRMIGPKVWIVDFNGKVSYLNKKQITDNLEQLISQPYQDKQESNHSLLECHDLTEVSFSKFLSNFKKGLFTKGNISPEFYKNGRTHLTKHYKEHMMNKELIDPIRNQIEYSMQPRKISYFQIFDLSLKERQDKKPQTILLVSSLKKTIVRNCLFLSD